MYVSERMNTWFAFPSITGVFCFPPAGKTHSMLGADQSALTLGVMPCAIAWLFKLINEQKDKTGARFSVRVSAVEVTGKNENLRDLLADIAQGKPRVCVSLWLA